MLSLPAWLMPPDAISWLIRSWMFWPPSAASAPNGILKRRKSLGICTQILRGRFQYALRAAYRDHTGRGVQAYKSQFEQRPQRVQYLVHFRGGSGSGNAIRTHAHAVVQAMILGR